MNKKNLIIILVTLISITLIFLYNINNRQYNNYLDENIFFNESFNENNNTNNIIEENNSKIKSSTIKVHIVGEINIPGLYELEEGSRINDLVNLSGGITENADLNKVNLAYELSDGEKIYIPSIFENTTAYIINDAGENVLENNSFSEKNSEKININKATSEQLQTISGIGPSLAEKIISYRNSCKKFNSVDELKNVPGIGEKKFESIKEFITVK